MMHIRCFLTHLRRAFVIPKVSDAPSMPTRRAAAAEVLERRARVRITQSSNAVRATAELVIERFDSEPATY